MKILRIVVVDDQTVVREGLVSILSYQSDIKIIGQAKDGIEAIVICKQEKPDVVLLDPIMPSMDGFASIEKIREVSPSSKILVLTSSSDADKVFRAIKSGAIGYLLKNSDWDQHLHAIRTVATGQSYIDPSITRDVITEMNPPAPLEPEDQQQQLTDREKQTLALISKGLKNSEIAEKLFVHERTIAKYVGNILSKLHLDNRTQAALYAMREGLDKFEE
jgi:NarL family two-component system response regulator LiaR